MRRETMSLWWLQPGWTETCCGRCGSKIYPEGDPDWGLCWPCMQHQTEMQEQEREAEERRRLEMEEMGPDQDYGWNGRIRESAK